MVISVGHIRLISFHEVDIYINRIEKNVIIEEAELRKM